MSNIKELYWSEKYRPKSFEEVASIPEGLLKLVNNSKVTGAAMPSLLFHSVSAGVGKTTSAVLIAKYLEADYIKVNSSDDRGIDFIRETVKSFAGTMSSNEKQKCVIFDEADGQTSQGQDALKGLIETYGEYCFFIFTCNDISQIITPIKSRCISFSFGSPSHESIKARLSYICDSEGFKIDEKVLDSLLHSCYPDIRSMVNGLQEYSINGKVGKSLESSFEEMLKYIKDKNYKAIYDEVWNNQFEMSLFTKWFLKHIFLNVDSFNEIAMSGMVYELSNIEKAFSSGANREIIFINSILQISHIYT